MKILVYGLNYAPELVGIGKYTHEMCEWLAARGHRIKVVTSYPYYPAWKVAQGYRNLLYGREQFQSVEIVRCPLFVPTKPTGASRLLHHLSFAASSAPVVARVAMTFRPDALFAVVPSQAVMPAALAAARMSGARSWLHIHDFEIESAFELGILSGASLRRGAERMERAALSRFDRVSTISSKMLDRLKLKHIPAERLVELRNWVDTSVIVPKPTLTALREKLGISPTSIVALYSGSMALKQGLDTVIEAARQVRAVKPDLVFLFCGAGAMHERLIAQSRDLQNVRFLDLQPPDRLDELLATADIHLLPQRAEIADLVLPSKLAPMLASGRPIVVMAQPGTQLASEVENAGLVVPSADANALVSALLRLTDDAELRSALGQAGRAIAQTRWDMGPILTGLEHQLLALTREAPTARDIPGPTAPKASRIDPIEERFRPRQ